MSSMSLSGTCATTGRKNPTALTRRASTSTSPSVMRDFPLAAPMAVTYTDRDTLRTYPTVRAGQRGSVAAVRRSVMTLATLVLLTACAGGVESSDAEPPSSTSPTVVESAERIALTEEVFADLDAGSPGCSVAVRHPDGTVDLHVGAADLDATTPIDRATIFDVGSVSKQFTAGAIALLVVEGDLALDDDVTELLPDLGPFDDTITVGDLLHHTSGLPDYLGLLDADLDEPTTTDDALAVIISDDGAPIATPGERFEYSNTNYVLLALIVEAVTGLAFPEVVATEILDPLGMWSSVVRDDQGALLTDQ